MSVRARPSQEKSTLYCSFCGKSQHEVRKLVAGPTTFICDECIILCDDILWDAQSSGRIRIRIKLPAGHEFDDTLNDAFARVIDEQFPDIAFKYECKTQVPGEVPDQPGSTVAIYSFDVDDSGTEELERLKKDLSATVRELAVTRTRFLSESKKREVIERELGALKNEYLEHLREKYTESRGREAADIRIVMFLDVSGFSKFPLREKERVVDILRGLAYPVLGAADAQHINMWGDAVVANFEDANKALECAIKFVRHLAVERLDIRIGMAWGEIRHKYNAAIGRKDIDGPTVDFAARLEQMADVGEILLSDEFGALDIVTSLAEIVPHKAIVKKDFANYKENDTIDVFKVKIMQN